MKRDQMSLLQIRFISKYPFIPLIRNTVHEILSFARSRKQCTNSDKSKLFAAMNAEKDELFCVLQLIIPAVQIQRTTIYFVPIAFVYSFLQAKQHDDMSFPEATTSIRRPSFRLQTENRLGSFTGKYQL